MCEMAQLLWKAAANVIRATEKHPFLVDMVNGTLHLDNFRYYVIQDALFLTDFATCLTILGTKMQQEMSEDNKNKEASIKRISELAQGIEDAEKELHRSFFIQYNIDASHAMPTPNTLLYTSYMIRVVSTRPYTEGLAVLLPCFWVYMHIGKCMLQLRDDLGDSAVRPASFDAWIDMYAGEDFETEVTDYIAIVDEAIAANNDDDTFKKMQEHFIMCCKLEYMFWSQAQSLMDWPGF